MYTEGMSNGADLVRWVHELSLSLSKAANLNELYRQSVQGLLSPLGFDRAALISYNPLTKEMQGTWGTDRDGLVVNESAYHSLITEGHASLDEALAQPDRIKVWEDCTLRYWDETVALGWNAMVVLLDGERVLGWLSVDNAFRHQPLSSLQREVLSLYGRTVSTLIQRLQFAELTEKYRAQNDLKDRLFTILAHDLRGPIGNLSVMLGFACDQPLEESDRHAILLESRQAALRTYNLLENVLGWVRGQMEEVAALRERIPVVRPLQSVQAWLEATAKLKGISLVVECPKTLTVMTDERMLETVVRNLVSNAVKYSPPGRPVTLRAERGEETIVINVEDQGMGMDKSKVATLFQKKQASSELGTEGESGSGLGLQFSTDLARTMGGRLEVTSKPGQGSTFKLILPDVLDGEL